jgi:hypothetical protein
MCPKTGQVESWIFLWTVLWTFSVRREKSLKIFLNRPTRFFWSDLVENRLNSAVSISTPDDNFLILAASLYGHLRYSPDGDKRARNDTNHAREMFSARRRRAVSSARGLPAGEGFERLDEWARRAAVPSGYRAIKCPVPGIAAGSRQPKK